MRAAKRNWQIEYIDHLERELVEARVRIAELERREWQRYESGDRPIFAMPDPGPDPDDGFEYRTDPTGVFVERVRIPDVG